MSEQPPPPPADPDADAAVEPDSDTGVAHELDPDTMARLPEVIGAPPVSPYPPTNPVVAYLTSIPHSLVRTAGALLIAAAVVTAINLVAGAPSSLNVDVTCTVTTRWMTPAVAVVAALLGCGSVFAAVRSMRNSEENAMAATIACLASAGVLIIVFLAAHSNTENCNGLPNVPM